MADTTRSNSDAALIKRETVSVKTKRQQPFVLRVFPLPRRRGKDQSGIPKQ